MKDSRAVLRGGDGGNVVSLPDQQRVWQDRFKLITTSGLLLILAHDLVSDEWRVIRVYD